MVLRSRNPWETTSKSELVSIGTHRLFLYASGPPRAHNSPVVIFFTGGGAPAAADVRLQSLLSKFVRVYFYDRSGYNWSEAGPVRHPTAVVAATELCALLRAVQVAPPYVLIGESYGCIVAREFLALCPTGVAGVVLAEAATELMYDLFREGIPDPNMAAVSAGVDLAEIMHFREKSKLSDEEWRLAMEAFERTTKGSMAEDCRGSGRPLAKKMQFQKQALGHRPLSVVRCDMASDFRVLYDAGVKAGNGTEEQRAGARKLIQTLELYDDDLRAAQLRLSSNHRYRLVPDCGHAVSILRPEVIVEEVKWVLGQLEPTRSAVLNH